MRTDRDERGIRKGVRLQGVLFDETVTSLRIRLQRTQVDCNVHGCDERRCTGSYLETALNRVRRANRIIIRFILEDQVFEHTIVLQ